MVWTTLLPNETNTPLIVDADAVLAGSIAFEALQPICRRDSKVVENDRPIEQTQLSQRDILDVRGQSPAPPTIPDTFGFPIRKASDHPTL
jgi:hypothetical protein